MGDLPMQSDVYAMTDLEFFDANPGAPEKLDPDNPDHADWIAAWSRIRDDVVNRLTDKAFFEFFPSAPQKLNPNDPADSTLIDYWNDIHDQIYDGRPGRYNWSTGPPASPDSADATGPVGTKPPPSADTGLPDVHDPNFAEEFKKWAHVTLTGGHGAAAVIEVASFWTAEGTVLFSIAEFTTPIGYALMLTDLFSEVIEAFGEGLKREKNRGFLFGLLWEQLGKPNIPWKSPGLNAVGLPDDPFHSDEESAEAFNEGVEEGRAKGREPEVQYGLGMAIAGYMAKQNVSIEIAANLVLNELFRQAGHTRFEDLDFP